MTATSPQSLHQTGMTSCHRPQPSLLPHPHLTYSSPYAMLRSWLWMQQLLLHASAEPSPRILTLGVLLPTIYRLAFKPHRSSGWGFGLGRGWFSPTGLIQPARVDRGCGKVCSVSAGWIKHYLLGAKWATDLPVRHRKLFIYLFEEDS